MIDLDIDCLYINGDSWSYGSELRDPTALHIKNDFDKVHDTYRQQHNWAGLLGQYYKMPVFNHAWAGGSNQRILRTALTDLTTLVRTGRKPFAIIAWTQMQRFELFSAEQDNWVEFVGPAADNKHPIGHQIWGKYSTDRSDLTVYLQQLVLMDAFLKTNNIPYLGTNIFRHNFNILEDYAKDPYFAPYLHQLSKTVQLSQHLYNVSVSQILTPHLDVVYGAGGHPLELGQQIIAEYFKNKINQQYSFKTA
jgi:hypothetical protein